MKAGTTDLLLQRASELRCAMDGHLVRRASRAVLPGYLLLAMQLAEEDPLGKHVTAEWAALQSRLSYSQSPLIPRWVPAAAGGHPSQGAAPPRGLCLSVARVGFPKTPARAYAKLVPPPPSKRYYTGA